MSCCVGKPKASVTETPITPASTNTVAPKDEKSKGVVVAPKDEKSTGVVEKKPALDLSMTVDEGENVLPFAMTKADAAAPQYNANKTNSVDSMGAKLQGYAEIVSTDWNASKVKDYLSKGVAADALAKYGQGDAKTFDQLAQELIRGECCFMQNEKGEIVRVVEIIWCKIPNPKNKDQILVEMERIYADGGKRGVKKILGGKRRPLESIAASAKRSINKELTLEDRQIGIDENALPDTGVAEDVRVSPSYPGLSSVYRVHIVPCEIKIGELDDDFLEELCLMDDKGGDFKTTEVTGDKHSFEWMSYDKAKELGAMPDLKMPEISNFDALLPISNDDFNWSKSQITTLLDGYKISYKTDTTDATNKNLENFTLELKNRELSIWENSSLQENKVYGIKTVLYVKTGKDGELFLDANGRLPKITLKGHESFRAGAKRLAKEYNAPMGGEVKAINVCWRSGNHNQITGLPMIVREVFVEY